MFDHSRFAPFSSWVRTRFVLLILFWLGWVGMLAGAIVIIVQAPRCKPIPEMNWWNEGPLYQISDTEAFSDGMEGKCTRFLFLLIVAIRTWFLTCTVYLSDPDKRLLTRLTNQ